MEASTSKPSTSRESKVLEDFPHALTDLDADLTQDLIEKYTGDITNFLQVGPSKVILPGGYRDKAFEFFKFRPYRYDILIMGFPCSGVLDIAWWLLHFFQMDPKEPKELSIERIPLLEAEVMATEGIMASCSDNLGEFLTTHDATSAIRKINETKGRRIYRSHLHIDFLHPDLLKSGCQVIYVVRSPKDVMQSLFEVHRKRRRFNKDFKTFADYFISDRLLYTPYWSHVMQAWQRRYDNNLYIVSYNQLIENLSGGLFKMLMYLHVKNNTYNRNQIDRFLQMYAQFKDNLQSQYYQAGLDDDLIAERVDMWQGQLDSATNRRIDAWIARNVGETGIRLPKFV